jgi:hypothetical protein
MAKEKSIKKRNWVFVAYPESAPENWRDILRETGLQCAISPLHDRDVDSDGKKKKEHWHVILCYSGPTSYNVVARLTSSLNASIPQALEQVRGYYRYLTHKDNPEKHQYDERDISFIGGFNIADFVELSKSEVNQIKRALQSLIRTEGFTEYGDLMDYLLDNEMFSEHDIASGHTYFFDKYIASKRYRAEQRR